MAPVRAQLNHKWTASNRFQNLLKDIFFQRLMNSTIDYQDVTKRLIVSIRSRSRDKIAIVQIYEVIIHKSGKWVSLDK